MRSTLMNAATRKGVAVFLSLSLLKLYALFARRLMFMPPAEGPLPCEYPISGNRREGFGGIKR